VIYASQVTPEQLRLEEALRRELQGGDGLRSAYEGYNALLASKPQYATHFGARLGSVEELTRRSPESRGWTTRT